MIWMWTWQHMKPHSCCHLRQLLPYTSQPPSHFTCVFINRGKCKWIKIVRPLMPQISLHSKLIWNVCRALGTLLEKMLIHRMFYLKSRQCYQGLQARTGLKYDYTRHKKRNRLFFKHTIMIWQFLQLQRLLSHSKSVAIKVQHGLWFQLLLFFYCVPVLPLCVKSRAD